MKVDFRGRFRFVKDDVVDIGATRPQSFGENRARVAGAGKEDVPTNIFEASGEAFARLLFGNDVGADAVALQGGRGCRANSGDEAGTEDAGVETGAGKGIEEKVDGVGARKGTPVVAAGPEPVDTGVNFGAVLDRGDGERRQLNDASALGTEKTGKGARLVSGTGDQDGLAKERPALEPANVLAEGGDIADHCQERGAKAAFPGGYR